MLQALLECDSTGNVLIRQLLDYRVGKRLKPPQAEIKDNILTAKAETDTLDIHLFLDSYYERMERLLNERETIQVNVLTKWQEMRLQMANIVLIILPLWGIVKFKKII